MNKKITRNNFSKRICTGDLKQLLQWFIADIIAEAELMKSPYMKLMWWDLQ